MFYGFSRSAVGLAAWVLAAYSGAAAQAEQTITGSGGTQVIGGSVVHCNGPYSCPGVVPTPVFAPRGPASLPPTQPASKPGGTGVVSKIGPATATFNWDDVAEVDPVIRLVAEKMMPKKNDSTGETSDKKRFGLDRDKFLQEYKSCSASKPDGCYEAALRWHHTYKFKTYPAAAMLVQSFLYDQADVATLFRSEAEKRWDKTCEELQKLFVAKRSFPEGKKFGSCSDGDTKAAVASLRNSLSRTTTASPR
jgi:hypothetical protein